MDWEDLYLQLDPKEPLEAEDPRLYQDLFGTFLDDVAARLSIARNRNFKLLLSGHTGCGKSTFLNLLRVHPKIEGPFFPVKFSIQDILDPNDATHIDILLSLVIQTLIAIDEAKDITINIEQTLLRKAEELYRELAGLLRREGETTSRRSRQVEAGTETGVNLNSIIAWFKSTLLARFKVENETRETVRQYYKPKMTDFLRTIDDVLLRIQAALQDKRLMILIDDTDKIPPSQGLDIFFENGQHLSAPKTNIVFMVDTSLSCSSKYATIVGKIGHEEFFPAIKTIERDGSTSATTKANQRMLRELVRQRAGKEFFPDTALNKAVEMSGGVVRELIRILQEAMFRARGRVRNNHVDEAVIRVRNGYNLYSDHVKVLKAVLESPNWFQTSEEEVTEKLESILLDLLYMPALFQYRNGEDKWYRPYPLFIPWLQNL